MGEWVVFQETIKGSVIFAPCHVWKKIVASCHTLEGKWYSSILRSWKVLGQRIWNGSSHVNSSLLVNQGSVGWSSGEWLPV